MTCNAHIGDIGTKFVVTIVDCTSGLPIDISNATEKKIFFTLPDKSVVEKAAVFVSDGSDGQIEYTTIVDDLSQAGKWRIQGFVIDAPYQNNSEIGEFLVLSNLI